MRLQQKATLFWQENLPACVAFFLFFCLGAACGFFAGRELFGTALPARTQAMLAEWMQPHCLQMLLFAVLAEVGWAAWMLFAGLQRWTIPLWMLGVALRGLFFGTVLALCVMTGSWVLWAAFLPLQPAMIVQALRLAALAVANLRTAPRQSTGDYMAQGIQRSLTLLLLAVMEATLLPLLLFVLLRN